MTPWRLSASLAAIRRRGGQKDKTMTLLRNALLGLAALGLVACGQKAPEPATSAAPESAPAATAPASANPALWRVSDDDTIVYLFGTVHVLPPALEWRTDKIDRALAESKAVYFETDLDPKPNEILPILQKLGMYPPSERLSDKLSAEDRAAFEKAANDLGLPAFQLDTMKPWLAGITLAEAMITKAGYDATSGVERKLAPSAIDAGKQIRKLETVEQQLLAFADVSENAQLRFLMDGVRQMDEEAIVLDSMVKAWAAGDIAQLEKIMIEEDFQEMPEIYDALLVKRNRNWATQIDKLVDTEAGTFFIAVGAAHLVGEDSVIEMLKPLGHIAERIE
jgi:uncharacterized protein YbaP (TraB family)